MASGLLAFAMALALGGGPADTPLRHPAPVAGSPRFDHEIGGPIWLYEGAEPVLPDRRYAPYALHLGADQVGRSYPYPRFLCYDCHMPGPYDIWDPYPDTCLRFRVVIYDDPYSHPVYRYGGTDVLYVRPQVPGRPRFVFKERAEGEAGAPLLASRPRIDAEGASGAAWPYGGAPDARDARDVGELGEVGEVLEPIPGQRRRAADDPGLHSGRAEGREEEYAGEGGEPARGSFVVAQVPPTPRKSEQPRKERPTLERRPPGEQAAPLKPTRERASPSESRREGQGERGTRERGGPERAPPPQGSRPPREAKAPRGRELRPPPGQERKPPPEGRPAAWSPPTLRPGHPRADRDSRGFRQGAPESTGRSAVMSPPVAGRLPTPVPLV
ncbi:MAG: hypothetical protein HY704_14430 [Gemmatimonadetes bacterium]|nr:hypothetical protein [Gemmatimonadota bacterium]